MFDDPILFVLLSILHLSTSTFALPAPNATSYFAGLFETLQVHNFTQLSLGESLVSALGQLSAN